AAEQLFGGLSAHLTRLREALIRAKAHLEARIDFSDEELDLDDAALIPELETARGGVVQLLHTYERGRLLRDGLRVAVTGLPNAGKASVLNALLGAERAIVTAEPGTTRDVIEASIDIDGVPVVLYDTAGLRAGTDEAERLGVDRARTVAAGADLVLVVLDTA